MTVCGLILPRVHVLSLLRGRDTAALRIRRSVAVANLEASSCQSHDLRLAVFAFRAVGFAFALDVLLGNFLDDVHHIFGLVDCLD